MWLNIRKTHTTPKEERTVVVEPGSRTSNKKTRRH